MKMRLDPKRYRWFDNHFPLDSLVGNVIVSKRGELTVGWELDLPPAYSLLEEEYDAMCQSLMSAIALLPPWCIVQRMDEYRYERYRADYTGQFLHDSYSSHFEGRPYLRHRSYVFVTLSSRQQCQKDVRRSAMFNFVFRTKGPSPEEVKGFSVKCGEFASVLSGCGHIGMRMLSADDYNGHGGQGGLFQRYLMLGDDGAVLAHPVLSKEGVELPGRSAMAFAVAESDTLPDVVSTVRPVKALASTTTQVFLSTGAGLGVLLDCDHVVNTYVMTMPQDVAEKELEDKNRRMRSSLKHNANSVASENITEFTRAMNAGLLAVRSHVNVIAWGRPADREEIRGKVTSAFSSLKMEGIYNTYDAPVQWLAGLPGAAAELGKEAWMLTHLGAAVALAPFETFERPMAGGRLRLSDRIRNVPLELDLSDVAYDLGLITAFGTILVGPTGTGKSFLTNKILSDKYQSGEHVFVVDIGNSYEFHTRLVNEISGGKDGVYMKWDPKRPPSFNAFAGFRDWLDPEGFLRRDVNGVVAFLSFIRTLWKPRQGWDSPSLSILNHILQDFIQDCVAKGRDKPVFDDFFKFVNAVAKKILSKDRRRSYRVGEIEVTPEKFDIENFVITLKDYSLDGPYRFLLNNPDPEDLFRSRWTCFELGKIAGSGENKFDTFFSIVLLFIMNSFDFKMHDLEESKTMVIDEAWRALANESIEPFILNLWKTGRKHATCPMVVTQQLSDLTASPVIRDTIIQNSPIRILLDQQSNQNNFEEYQRILGMSDIEKNLCLSINKGMAPGIRGNQVFISWAGRRFGVYTYEASVEEALIFESKEQKKKPLLLLAERKGSIVEAARELAETIREGRRK